jgi:hypothetical protein
MSKPKWACSSCGMYSSRRWSVERHILNLHDGIGNFIPFVDYLVRRSGFYLPKFRPSFVKKNATKTVTVMDTFKDELLKDLLLKQSIRPYIPHKCKTINLISNDLIVMGPLTSILVNTICILFQDLKIYLVSKYTFAKNAHL